MNFNQIFSEIEKKDPEVYERLDTRRDSMKQFARFGGKVALTALPFALGGIFQKAYAGKSTTSIVDVLNFALTLEYLESSFYRTGVDTKNLFTSNPIAKEGYKIINKHEAAHVNFLQTTIRALGGKPVKEPKFDFTAGGTFPNVFSDYGTFLAVSQAFEDTGVRAYKGQAGNLISSDTVLTAALQIHSVEARHASFVRTLRADYLGNNAIRPWITGSSSDGIGSAVQANYKGEDNTVQLGIQIKHINGYDIDDDDASESFDEPLTMTEVLAIVSPFIVG